MHIIMDTDPGGDDAIALMWLASLFHQKRLAVKAVTTVAGNVGADKTWRNAHGLLNLCALQGAAVAIGDVVVAERDAAEIHGEDGLGGLADSLPEAPADPHPRRSANLLQEVLQDNSPAATLLAVAPLTNLAQAEASSPGLLRKANDIFIMGGALKAGNVTAAAEFNFFFDPRAAADVLAACRSAKLVTLETSSDIRLEGRHTSRIIKGLEATPAALFFQKLCAFMEKRDARFSGKSSTSGFPVHDAATVAWLAYPELFESMELGVSVDIKTGDTKGRLRQSDGPEATNCHVATRVDADALLDTMGRDLKLLFELLHSTQPD